MYFRNIKEEELYEALERTNKDFKGNLEWLKTPFFYKRNVISARIKAISLDLPGSRWMLGCCQTWKWDYSGGSRSSYACWHAHGTLFDHLLDINPEAEIRSGSQIITLYKGNWEDQAKTSPWNGNTLYYSDSCLCNLRKELIKISYIDYAELPLFIHEDSFDYAQSRQYLESRLKNKDIDIETFIKEMRGKRGYKKSRLPEAKKL